jgi:hypothetical protein
MMMATVIVMATVMVMVSGSTCVRVCITTNLKLLNRYAYCHSRHYARQLSIEQSDQMLYCFTTCHNINSCLIVHSSLIAAFFTLSI